MRQICNVCGWEYDEAKGYPFAGIEKNTPWNNVPEDFFCPLCGADKNHFREIDKN